MSEEVIFRQGNIEVSKTMAKFGNVTYPIAGIGSVFVAAPSRVGLYVAAAVAVLIGFWIGADAGAGAAIVGLIVGGVLALIAYNLKYRLMLRTASGDQQALESRTEQLVVDVKTAIERAVVLRG